MSREAVFTFFTETWADAQVRQMCMPGDRLLLRLLEGPETTKVLAANPFRSAPARLARRLTSRPGAAFPVDSTHRLISPLRWRRRDPTGTSALSETYRDYDRRLRRGTRAMRLTQPAVVTCNPLVAAMCPLEWAERVTYYAWDDWASLPALQPWWPDYERAYRRIGERGIGVVAVSEVLLDRIDPAGPAQVVPNAVDPQEWMQPGTPPHWFLEQPRPRILYAGNLQERLDTASLRSVADSLIEGSVIVVGPIVNPAIVEELQGPSNLSLWPRADRASLAALIAAADVCVMPHRKTPLTEAMSPLKIYEYLAGGAPVVATDLPPVRNVDPRVVLVPPGSDFAAGVDKALSMPRAAEPERIAFVMANSWAVRLDRVLEMALG